MMRPAQREVEGRSRRYPSVSLVVLLLLLPLRAAAQTETLRWTNLNERVEEISIVPAPGGGERINMSFTSYRPDGPGPFPLVIVNHGQSSNPRTQARDRPIVLARELVARGYAVVAPMRRGFAETPGTFLSNPCVIHRRIDKDGLGWLSHLDSTGEVFDLHAFVNAIVARPYVDRTRLLLVSQSGGLTSTLGYMTTARASVRGYINFVGGGFFRCGREHRPDMSRAAGQELGPAMRGKGLWIYATQDSFVPAAEARVMFDSLIATGARTHWIELAPPIEEGHYMIGEFRAVPTWWPHVESFLNELGLPTERRYRVKHGGRTAASEPTAFAPIADARAVPYLNAVGREAYAAFLASAQPRAFAIARNGAFAAESASLRASDIALNACRQRAGTPCALYAIDDIVVWDGK
jgi:dienelactone hydrolase